MPIPILQALLTAPAEQSFVMDDETSLEASLAALRHAFAIESEAVPKLSLIYLDTFDWRLHGRSVQLAAHRQGRSRWRLFRLETGKPLRHQDATSLPAFSWDLQDSEFARDLETVIAMRRLLPMAEITLDLEMLRFVDERRKTVVRALLERGTASAPGSSEVHSLPPALRLMSVRGYGDEARQVAGFLIDQLGSNANVAGNDRLTEALAALGRQAGDYSSKTRLRLDPRRTAGEAVRKICQELLATVRVNEEGTRLDLDSEFLHDFRVAVRRTRSILSQVKGVFPTASIQPFRDEFKWLGSVTGPTRDLDVYLLKLPRYRELLPAGIWGDLRPLAEFLEREQRREQRKLARALKASRYRQLIESWDTFLGAGVEAAPNTDRPVVQVASERIWKLYRRVCKEGGRIDSTSPDAALHDLRITCKKLRYLLEFFRSLFEEEAVGKLIKELKRLQDNLGDFNDLSVQQEHLHRFAERMLEEKLAPASTFMAMGRLIALLEEDHRHERQRFGKRFETFVRPSNEERFKALFRSAG